MKTKITPKDDANKKLDDDKKMMKQGILEGVRRAMYFAESKSKERFGTPDNLRVVSGRLRSSIMTKVINNRDSVKGIIGTDVYYGKLHELGIGKFPPRPFIRPSIEENIDKIREIITENMEKKL